MITSLFEAVTTKLENAFNLFSSINLQDCRLIKLLNDEEKWAKMMLSLNDIFFLDSDALLTIALSVSQSVSHLNWNQLHSIGIG